MANLIETIKKISQGANEASAPCDLLFGVVTSISPLEITVEQKLKLTQEFLILTKNVKDYTVEVSIDWETENKTLNANHSHSKSGSITVNSKATVSPNPDSIQVSVSNEVTDNTKIDTKSINLTHNHEITGKKKMTIHNGLKRNDTVILIQKKGGQEYVVIDKI